MVGGSNGVLERRDGPRQEVAERRETTAPNGDGVGDDGDLALIAAMRDAARREVELSDRKFDRIEKRIDEIERKLSRLVLQILIAAGAIAGIAYGPDLIRRLVTGFVTGGP